MRKIHWKSTIAAALACLATSAVQAQTYPTKPVRIVVPFAPGGGTDVIARFLATGLSESVKRQFIVENRAGANAIIGTELVARAPADGYTLLFVSSPHSVNPSMYAKLPYDTLRDFVPVSMIASSPYFLVVHPSLPVRNVRELITLAKKQPDQILYGSGGSGSSAHLTAELFNQMAGVKTREVPFKGAGPALIGTLTGEISMVFGNALTVKPHIESGRLRALGIASAQRSKSAPNLPTIAEAGVPGFRSDAVLGLLAPARTPREIVSWLNAESHKVMNQQSSMDAMRAMAVDIALSSPEEFGNLIQSEMQRWGKVIRALNLKPR
ncbi:MAG: tripartite tricarboxylate transporter substrate binding protein [Burkholderiales bacterium]|nr:tripartite tricarboxylate transporter substrate binding protein [Burkholderiales bacterium]MDP2397608.1 tripartite tricarboxylate transporter substrate binding protein [Burkholderiales bacterium]